MDVRCMLCTANEENMPVNHFYARFYYKEESGRSRGSLAWVVSGERKQAVYCGREGAQSCWKDNLLFSLTWLDHRPGR